MSKLRAFQVEPVDDVVRALTLRPGQALPVDGLRAQLIAAPGTGKTFMSAHAGMRIASRGPILVLVPTLDLLSQTIDTWRAAGRAGRMYAVCSMADHEPATGVLCTTSSERLAFWLSKAGKGVPVTVFGTYASLPTVIGAHGEDFGQYGISAVQRWSALIVDEAHRTSGAASKPWAAVHDNQALPAAARLYMTATPRVWNIPETLDADRVQEDPQAGPAYQSLPRELAMSMDDEAVFGPVANKSLTLMRSQDIGVLARFQLVALEIVDPILHAMLETESESAVEARLAAIQVAVLKAIRTNNLKKVITFHNRIAECEVFASTLPRRIDTDDDLREAFPNGIWARWLSGEHTGRHRKQVLTEFDDDKPGGLERPALIANAKVLAEGLDTRSDAVVFTTPKGSLVELIQAIGRALRQQPGAGKVASILVPVIVAQAAEDTLEDAATTSDLIADPGFKPLFDILQGLRSYDSSLIEGLAVPQRRSGTEQPDPQLEDDAQDPEQPRDAGVGVPRMVLEFAGGLHTAAEVAAAVRLRVLSPEAQNWLRGYAAARRWHEIHSSMAIPVDATCPGSDFPLGRWAATQRAAYAADELLPSRVDRLDELGMVWNAHDAAWDANLAIARTYAATHTEHLACSANTVADSTKIGRWLVEQRSAANAGTLTQARTAQLAEIDPWWNPTWPLPWQRSYRIALAHTDNSGTLQDLLDMPDGTRMSGQDIGKWTRAQQARWHQLQPGQQELLSRIGLTPAAHPAAPAAPPARSQADRFNTGLAAAQAWAAQHGGTIADIKRKDVAVVDGIEVKAGLWIGNQRQRAAKLTDEQRAALSKLGMRW
ncbi:Helicase associated domain protein [Streptacidiphilus sp. N1-12]|uniref:Helicase associated domain protein n=2 Tax=Streptacidiphilus alkalitolerans TaxID=3342712 RepID=A0ABV6WQ48_9ACTN